MTTHKIKPKSLDSEVLRERLERYLSDMEEETRLIWTLICCKNLSHNLKINYKYYRFLNVPIEKIEFDGVGVLESKELKKYSSAISLVASEESNKIIRSYLRAFEFCIHPDNSLLYTLKCGDYCVRAINEFYGFIPERMYEERECQVAVARTLLACQNDYKNKKYREIVSYVMESKILYS